MPSPRTFSAFMKAEIERTTRTLDILYGSKVLTPQSATYCGIPIHVDPNIEDGKVYIIPAAAGGQRALMNTQAYRELLRQSVGLSNSSLNSLSEMTIEDDMTEQTNMIETAELLVELDRTIAQFGGQFGTRVTCSAKGYISDFSDRLVMTGKGKIDVGYEFIPYGLIVMNTGAIRFILERAPELDQDTDEETHVDTTRVYVGLDLDALDDCFPDVSAAMRRVLYNADLQPTHFINETEHRLHGKSALIALVHDHLKVARDLINEHKAEQDREVMAGFYGKKDDFGAF